MKKNSAFQAVRASSETLSYKGKRQQGTNINANVAW